MKIKAFFLYGIGIALLIFGNRELWDKLKAEKEEKQQRQALADANEKVKLESFEVQKLEYDSVSGQWKNPDYYFQVINAGNPNFKALKKGSVKVESNTDENASDSQ